jgi:two-component system chemotaxis sensor kinase CheA
MLPLLRLGEVFRLENVPRGSRVFVVVAGFGARRLGLVVDDLIGQQEVVIKNLGKRVEGARGIAGAAEIGKHEVILVIDVESLMDEAMLSRKAVRPV